MLITNIKAFLKFLERNKIYTAVTVIGFSVSLMFVIVLGLYVRGELSVDKFHAKGDRIYLVTNDMYGGKRSSFANPTGPWLTDNYPDVESFTRVMTMGMNGDIEMPDGKVVATEWLLADSTFFNIFSFPLIEGNPRDVLAAKNAAVITRSFATKIFGEADPVGKSLTVSGRDFDITGVMADFPHNTIFPPVDFVANYARLPEYWNSPDIMDTWENGSFPLFILERKGSDIRAKNREIVEKFTPVSVFYKIGFASEMEFVPLEEVYFGEVDNNPVINLRRNDTQRVMLYLGITLLILVVALLNYINMTVAQAGFRGKEVALKKLNGANRLSIVAQLLTESFIVTLLSFGIGVALAFAFESFFDDVLATTLDLAGEFTLPMVAAMAGLIVLLALVSGIIPAMMMSRFKPIEIIKGSFSRRVKGVYSRVLAVFQYTVSIALLICSAFIVMQSHYLASRDVGLRKDGVLLLQSTEPDSDRKTAIKRSLADIPGVEAVSLMSQNPFNANRMNKIMDVDGGPLSFEFIEVDSIFFRLFEVKVESTGVDIAGIPSRDILYLNRAAYNALDAERTDNMVNLGSNFMIGGIVDFNFRPLNEPQGLMMMQISGDDMSVNVIAVRISKNSDVLAVGEKVRDEYADMTGYDRFEWEWADETVHDFYEAERRTSRIMGAFTVLVVLIMLMGIFAMSIYVLRQKEREIAIRKVHGSTVGEVLALLGRQSTVSVAVAFAAAVPMAWWAMSRWLQGFSWRVDLAWWVFATAGVLVLVLTFVCVGWQSWRAATTNPVKTLKSE